MFFRKKDIRKSEEITRLNVFDVRFLQKAEREIDGKVFLTETLNEETKEEALLLSKKLHQYNKEAEHNKLVEQNEEMLKRIEKEFGLDEVAYVDVFCRSYDVAGSNRHYATKYYINAPARWCLQKEELHIIFGMDKYTFLLKEIKNVREVNERISFYQWNKKERFEAHADVDYQMGRDRGGLYYVQPYYRIEIERDNNPYEIIAAPYDARTLYLQLSEYNGYE